MSSRSPICAMCLSASSRARPRPTSLTRCYPGLGRPHRPRPPSRADARGAVATLTIDAMKSWLEGELGRVSAKSVLAEAIRYALRHWKGLGLFLDDGRVEIDSNTVERTIRPIKLGALLPWAWKASQAQAAVKS